MTFTNQTQQTRDSGFFPLSGVELGSLDVIFDLMQMQDFYEVIRAFGHKTERRTTTQNGKAFKQPVPTRFSFTRFSVDVLKRFVKFGCKFHPNICDGQLCLGNQQLKQTCQETIKLLGKVQAQEQILLVLEQFRVLDEYPQNDLLQPRTLPLAAKLEIVSNVFESASL